MTVEKPKPKQFFRPITTGARKQRDEPITTPSNYLQLAQSAGKESLVRGAIGFGFTSHWLKN